MSPETADGPILLYDGTCGFCADSVQFVLRRDRKRTLRFAALDSASGQALLVRHPQVRGFDSVLFVAPATNGSPEEVFAHSEAAIQVATYLGGRWAVFRLARIIPRAIRDMVYRFVARHRHRLSGNRPHCVVPSVDERARFLD